MSRRLRIVRDHDDDFIVDLLPSAPRIEPVQYEAKTVDLIKFWYRHYWVARFEFAVYDCPATHGRVLCHLFAYYRVGSPISPRSHLGQFFDLLGRRPTRTNPDLRVRAAVTPQGLIHVVLINDSLSTDHVVDLSAPADTRKTAIVERLTAPSAAATDGVTLAGQSFGTETDTGTLTGPFNEDHLQPTNGHYTVDLPASSAAMISFAPAHPIH